MELAYRNAQLEPLAIVLVYLMCYSVPCALLDFTVLREQLVILELTSSVLLATSVHK